MTPDGMGLRRPSRRGLAVLAAAAALVVSSCGLEEYVYLEPPDTTLSSNICTLTNNTQNDPAVFVGYRFLYKFLPNEAAVASAISTVTSLFTSYPTSIYSRMKTSAAFRDLRIGNDEELDLAIAVPDRGTSFMISLDYSLAVTGTTTDQAIMVVDDSGIGTQPALPAELRRTVTGYSGIGFSLTERNAVKYDDLISGANYDPDTGKTYLLIYVLAIGYDSSFIEVYSQPAYFVGGSHSIEMSVEID